MPLAHIPWYCLLKKVMINVLNTFCLFNDQIMQMESLILSVHIMLNTCAFTVLTLLCMGYIHIYLWQKPPFNCDNKT